MIWVQIKEKRKRIKVIGPCQRTKMAMEYECDGDDIYN